MRQTIILGDLITPCDDGTTLELEGGGFVIDHEGTILEVKDKAALLKKYPEAQIVDAHQHLILPGLIDTHSHLPQYPISGSSDLPLNEWLKEFVYPAEMQFSTDLTMAKRLSRLFFQKSLSLGTTALATFSTSSTQATSIIFEEAKNVGVRAFIGKVLMDYNGIPELLQDSKVALEELENLKQQWHLPGQLEVTVNPRFLLVCSEELLRKAGEFARKNNLLLHSHLDSVPSFLLLIKEFFPWARNLLQIFQETGCIAPRSLFAHGTGLSEEEYETLDHMQTALSHCPNSNNYCCMGMLSVRNLKNIPIGLGSDSGGGPTLSLFDVMRCAGDTSKIIAAQQGDEKWLSVDELLRMGTLTGAKILGINKITGSLETGKKADFIIIDDQSTDPLFGDQELKLPYQSLKERLSRVIYRSHPALVLSTFINGKKVFERNSNKRVLK